MAGRPVAARGGLSGLHYGVITMTIVAVVCLVLFILQLTSNQSLKEAADTAKRQAERFGTPNSYYVDEANNRKTSVSAVVEDDRKRVAKLVAGTPEAVAVTIEAQGRELLAQVAADNPGLVNDGDTLFAVIKRMSAAARDAKGREAGLNVVANELQAEVSSLTAQLKSIRDEFESQVVALDKQARQAEEDKSKQLQKKDEQLGSLQGTLDAREQQLQKLRQDGSITERQKELEIARLTTQIADLRGQIQSLKPATFDPNAILTKSDGRILRAIPGSDIVYINLGEKDKAKVGMGFEVYSQTRETPKGLRGKASVEIINLLDGTSECRVTRSEPGQPIVEGDVVVNIAYERSRVPKFVVAGEFDLNYDGNPDFDGEDRIAAMIKQWGGQVVPELDESVDYVIIGTGPTVPTFGDGQVVSDVVRDQAQQRALEQSQFRALIDRARAMYIPVITQNQFLFLTGNAGEQQRPRR